jgi:sterol desaturase/sphingolipid hydroxylase (fatty acid hydroxylase superfamily)
MLNLPLPEQFVLTFLLWSLGAYWFHRLGHVAHRLNPLFKIHMAHHRVDYDAGRAPGESLVQPQYFLLWYGNLAASADVWITIFIPAIVLSIFNPATGIPLIVLLYFYEAILSERLLDHNPNMRGPLTVIFAWGNYHLSHHHHVRTNYGLYITLWDRVFGTVRVAPREAAAELTQHSIKADWGLAL